MDGNPQKEEGYTAIANEILEALVCFGLNGTEFALILFVLRRTYGFGKKEDWISYTQFQNALKTPRSNVYRSIQSLVAKRLLVANPQPGKTIYGFNKRYSEWVVANPQLVAKMGLASCENGIKVVANPQPTKERSTKERLQKKDLFIRFWEIYPRKVGKPVALKRFCSLSEAEGQAAIDALPAHIGSEQWQEGYRFIPHPATWLNQRRWEDPPPPPNTGPRMPEPIV